MIAAWEHTPHGRADFLLEIYGYFGVITNAANALVAWLSHYTERNIHWRMLEHRRYNDNLKALDSSGKVTEMVIQYHSTQKK